MYLYFYMSYYIIMYLNDINSQFNLQFNYFNNNAHNISIGNSDKCNYIYNIDYNNYI